MKALITSGGGAKGAFSVGALEYLFENGSNQFDIISGTSTGSLIAAMACIGRIDILTNVYTTVNNDDVLVKQNIIAALTNGNAYLFDTDPLKQEIERYVELDNNYQKIFDSPTILCLSAINMRTGATTVFTTKDLSFIKKTAEYEIVLMEGKEMLMKALMASSSQAAFLPAVEINGDLYVDGGNREVIPTRIVVDYANCVGAITSNIIVLSNNPAGLFKFTKRKEDISLLDNLFRAISIFVQETRENDLEVLRNSHPGYKIILPDDELDEDNPTGLSFIAPVMKIWKRKGYLSAQKKMAVLLAKVGG